MTVKASVGLRNEMMSGFKTLMDGCTLKIYGGTVPANAQDAIGSATLLCEIFNGNDGSTPLTFDATTTDGILQKNAAEPWAGTVATTGTATFYRLEFATDDQLASITHKRLQGDVGIAGKDLTLTSVALVQGGIQPVKYFSVVLPAA